MSCEFCLFSYLSTLPYLVNRVGILFLYYVSCVEIHKSKSFFYEIFALKSFLFGCIFGIVAVCLYYAIIIYTKEGIRAIFLILLTFISGGGMQIYGMLLKFHLCNNTSGIHFGLTQNIIIFVMTSLLIGLLLVDIMACSPFVILGAMLKESIMNNGILAR